MKTLEEYLSALEKAKNSPKDRVGILGEIGITGLGVGTGVVISGTIAGVAGASTLFGSSTLGSMLGGVFITATPIGWVVGSAAAAGALAYGAVKLYESGVISNYIKEMDIEEYKKIISDLQKKAKSTFDYEVKYKAFMESIQYAVAQGKITRDKANKFISGVQSRQTDIDFAISTLKGMIK